jgi:hypothetical protein
MEEMRRHKGDNQQFGVTAYTDYGLTALLITGIGT